MDSTPGTDDRLAQASRAILAGLSLAELAQVERCRAQEHLGNHDALLARRLVAQILALAEDDQIAWDEATTREDASGQMLLLPDEGDKVTRRPRADLAAGSGLRGLGAASHGNATYGADDCPVRDAADHDREVEDSRLQLELRGSSLADEDATVRQVDEPLDVDTQRDRATIEVWLAELPDQRQAEAFRDARCEGRHHWTLREQIAVLSEVRGRLRRAEQHRLHAGIEKIRTSYLYPEQWEAVYRALYPNA